MSKKIYKLKDEVIPVREYTAEDIKRIRKKTGTTQGFLANWLGVSKKTIQAWESGRNIPNGASARLLSLLEMNDVSIDVFLLRD
jgi:putative transcriptional regulator